MADLFDIAIARKLSGGGGGGGSSDFTTATVTLTNNITSGESLIVPFTGAFPSDDGFMIGCIFLTNVPPLNTVQVDVALYKGAAIIIPIDGFEHGSATGDIEFDNDKYEFIVSGDGTITIS